MKVQASLKGRAIKNGRRYVGLVQVKRKGIIRLYATDDNTRGRRVNTRGSISRRRKALVNLKRKY